MTETVWTPRPWLASLLNVFLIPSGYVYLGRLRAALVNFLTFTVISVLGTLYPAFKTAATILLWLLVIGTAIHVYMAAKKAVPTRLSSRFAKVWQVGGIYLGLFLIVLFAFMFAPYELNSMPSSSMMPTIKPDTVLLVDKQGFGNYRLLGYALRENHHPLAKRGDLVIFYFPLDPQVRFVKRLIGLPGDKLVYNDKALWVNGRKATQNPAGSGTQPYSVLFEEVLDGRRYRVQVDADKPPVMPYMVNDFPYSSACRYSNRGFECTVPEGQYFMLGDNRDNSNDSRYWGFVPATYLIGKVSVK